MLKNNIYKHCQTSSKNFDPNQNENPYFVINIIKTLRKVLSQHRRDNNADLYEISHILISIREMSRVC